MVCYTSCSCECALSIHAFEANVQDADAVNDLLEIVELESGAAVCANVPDLPGGGSLATVPLQPEAHALVPYLEKPPRERSTTQAVPRNYSELSLETWSTSETWSPMVWSPTGAMSCVIMYIHNVSC